MVKPLIGLTARVLGDGRVTGWTGAGIGERDKYLQRLRASGALPVLLDPAPCTADDIAVLVSRLDAVVLTGGPDVEPLRYGADAHETVYGTDTNVDDFEFAIAREARTQGVPLLAICRGLQVLNVAFGGSLHQHLPDLAGVEAHGRPGFRDGELHHLVKLTTESRVSTVMGTLTPTVSCHHHQSVDRIADGWRVVGRAADGIIEAIEPIDPTWFALAVQWHPEDTAPTDATQQALFDATAHAATRQ